MTDIRRMVLGQYRYPSPVMSSISHEEPAMTLLTVDQAAQRLGTKPRFIRRLIAERRIPYVKLGSHVRLDDSDIDAFIDAGRVTPAPRQLRLGYPHLPGGASADARS
jgi:excisionase family DNA binding protein